MILNDLVVFKFYYTIKRKGYVVKRCTLAKNLDVGDKIIFKDFSAVVTDKSYDYGRTQIYVSYFNGYCEDYMILSDNDVVYLKEIK